jgi:hypothetical protein
MLILGPPIQFPGSQIMLRDPSAFAPRSSSKQGPRCPGLLVLRPIQYRDSLCVGLGMLPVTEGIAAPPFISRAFAFSCIPELMWPSPIRCMSLQITYRGFRRHSKADRVFQVLDMVVEPQALYNQRPGFAWTHPSREVPDPTLGCTLEFDSSKQVLVRDLRPIRSPIRQQSTSQK